jgi:hypothetical protein
MWGEGVNFGGSWVASYSSPLPRRGRGAATHWHVVNIVAFSVGLVTSCVVRSQVTLPKLGNTHTEKCLPSYTFVGPPLHATAPTSLCSLCLPTDLRWTDGPFGPQRYYLHLLLRRLVPRGSPRVRFTDFLTIHRLSAVSATRIRSRIKGAVSDNERIRYRRLRKRHGDWILSAHV